MTLVAFVFHTRHIHLVLVEEPRVEGKASVDDRAEAASALIGRLRGAACVREVEANVGTPDVHIAHTHVTAVKIVVAEEVEDGVGQEDVDQKGVDL